MLDQLDLSQRLGKAAFKQRMEPLQLRISQLARAASEQNIPVILVFDGWSTSGRAEAIAELTSQLDPRGYRVYPIKAPTQAEEQFPWLYRFFLKVPARGEIAIFHGSWYRHVLFDRVSKRLREKQWQRAFQDILAFERMLAEDGALIVKMWLHISQQEQRRRIDAMLGHEATAWRVRDEERLQRKNYQDHLLAAEDMFGKTETEYAPWVLIPANDTRYMMNMAFETIAARLEAALAKVAPAGEEPQPVAKILEAR